MSDSARFALQRPEHVASLVRGEAKINALMRGSAFRVAAGEVLIKANTEHGYVYRLLSGWMCRTRTIEDGRDQCILVFLPGDLFAVKSMFFTCHTDDVKALADATIERVDYRVLHAAFSQDADIANRCIGQVLEEERRLHSWVFGLGQGSAEERLAMLLVDFRGRLTLSGTIELNALSFPMPLTQTQLADHLGVTAIHVNRVLKTFRESGIVSVRDGEVAILDSVELTRRARPLLDAYERKTPEYIGIRSAQDTGDAISAASK
jgi:CRP/FNR family transcriptional regulator, anaerobic regulatory protein